MIIKPYVAENHALGLINILNEPGGHYYTESHIDLSNFQEAFVYEANDRLLGFLCIEVHPRTSQIICYVSPKHRYQGIGSRLFEFGRSRLTALDPNTIWVFFRSDVGESARFYQNRGALPWYSYHNMIHCSDFNDGAAYNQCFDSVIPYNPDWFDTYLSVRADAFYEVNKMIDSRPYDERERRYKIEEWTERNREKIWLFLRAGELIGSVANFDGFLDEVFVKSELKGQSIGKAIINWSLMHCKNNGWSPQLCVVSDNVPAIKLYESMGFNIAQTLEMNRFFSCNKEPDYSGPIGG